MSFKYYVYIFLDPRKPGNFYYGDRLNFNFEPFYVGKGTKNRINQHFSKKEMSNKSFKTNKFNKIIKEGFSPVEYCIKLAHFLKEDDALQYEKEVINKIGRIKNGNGPLINLTDGGEKTTWVTKGKTYEELFGKKEAKRLKELRRNHLLNNNNPRRGKPAWNRGKKMNTGTKISIKTSNPVYQIHPYDNSIVKEYQSISIASKETNICKNTITSACCAANKSAGKFFWCYKKKYTKWIRPKQNFIYQLDNNSNLINYFSNMCEAARHFNVDRQKLQYHIKKYGHFLNYKFIIK